ncbi:DUF2637 domain-containing protein [Streptomyces sp. NPDC001002]
MHQREFAVQGGADRMSATLWPLSVDGLLLLATVGVLKPAGGRDRRMRVVVGWLSCWGSRCLWRRILRRRRFLRGSRCWWRGGRRWRCCLRWSFLRIARVRMPGGRLRSMGRARLWMPVIRCWGGPVR